MTNELINDIDLLLINYMKKTYPQYSPLKYKPDKRYIHPNVIGISPEAAEEFNKIISWVMQSDIANYRLGRTERNCLCKKRQTFCGCGWDIEETGYSAELTLIYEGMWRIRFATDSNKENGISGREALQRFKAQCAKYGINLDEYIIDNGPDVKKDIEKYMIGWGTLDDISGFNNVFEGVHHIDFHNSFPAGLVNTHPEFYDVVNELYMGRKTNPQNKEILNLTIGAFQSLGLNNACWAHLSRDAIADNNKRIRDLRDTLLAAGRVPLAYNTDGIWYYGDIYHGEGEGPALGQWENDHINCRIRFKSVGCYEFEENGEYHPVVRGKCYYDRVKAREQWQWGDIFRDDAIPFGWYFDWDKMKLIKLKGDELNDDAIIERL